MNSIHVVIPLRNQNGALINPNNSTDMYQYFEGQVYPVMPTMDTNFFTKNLTCDFISIDEMCPYYSSLPPLISNISGVFKCLPGSKEGLELFLTLMDPLSIYAHQSESFEIAASFFMTLALILIFSRYLNCFCESEAVKSKMKFP